MLTKKLNKKLIETARPIDRQAFRMELNKEQFMRCLEVYEFEETEQPMSAVIEWREGYKQPVLKIFYLDEDGHATDYIPQLDFTSDAQDIDKLMYILFDNDVKYDVWRSMV